MGGNLIKKPFLIALAVMVGIIAILMITFTSCTTSVLENNQLENSQETLELINKVFPEADYYYYDEEKDIYTVYNTNKSQIGYAFYAEGMSYSGEGFFSKQSAPMTILIGLKDKETIKNIYVVSHGETLDLWNLLVSERYFDQFIGLKIEDAALKNNGGQIDAATGATLSSKSVVDIVRGVALTKFGPVESKIEWQNILTLSIVIPFILIPVVFIWYATIKQARVKRVP